MAPSLNKANRDLITATFNELDLRDDESCLDIGFGGGLLLRMAAEATGGQLWGADFSPDVVAAGRRSMSTLIKSGRLNLVTADALQLPFRDSFIDAVCTVNTVYFLPDLARAFSEARRILCPKGRLAIGYTGREKMKSFENIAQHGFHPVMPDDVEGALRASGFVDVRTVELTGPVTSGDFVTVATA